MNTTTTKLLPILDQARKDLRNEDEFDTSWGKAIGLTAQLLDLVYINLTDQDDLEPFCNCLVDIADGFEKLSILIMDWQSDMMVTYLV